MSNNNRFQDDPFAEREAEKYENPVPSREFIIKLLSDDGQLLSFKQLAAAFELSSEEELEGLRRRLRAMERDGQLIRNRRNGYGVVKKMDLICGRVIGHPDGFGFLVPDEGGDDLFVSAKRMRGLMHGDRAVVRVAGLDHRGRREAAPVEVLERANHQLVGRLHEEHGICYVVANNKRITQDILVPQEFRNGAHHGQIVVVKIVEHPTWTAQGIGHVVELMGDHMAPGMEIDIAIRSYDIPNEWPQSVLDEIKHLSPEVREEDKKTKGREDIRNLPLVTIDGEDSRDFDDAVYCEPNGKGWRLLVAIADVSHYVKPGTALDEEALKRGNSVYFPERVVPMLPEILSNQLCSLNPKTDRLCLVGELMINANGTTRKHRFFHGVMRSAERLTYTQVSGILEKNDEALKERFAAVVPYLRNLYDLYKALDQRRQKRGAIEFETVETKIVFGQGKKIEQIVPVKRNDAHKLIEECMIAANVAAAEFILDSKIPGLFRVHQGPAEEKFADLRKFLSEFGLKLPAKKNPEPKHYAQLIQEIKGRPDAHLISMVLLRSLSQAVYCPDNKGHFGLAFEAYTHYTSPIRRYPDLIVHRAISHVVSGKKVKAFNYSVEKMEHFGEHCSMTERRADDATRDVVDWLKCEYLSDKVGQEFDGRVTSVTSFGLFVELVDLYVEGLVHITALDNDYYHFDQVNHRLTGERTKRIFRLSDPLRVRVVRVNLDDKKVDFELVGLGAPGAKKEAPRGEKPAGEKRRSKKGPPKKATGGEQKAARRKPRRRKPKPAV